MHDAALSACLETLSDSCDDLGLPADSSRAAHWHPICSTARQGQDSARRPASCRRTDEGGVDLSGAKAERSGGERSGKANGENDTDPIKHSLDFASVNWNETLYTFTPNQAACVKLLYEQWSNGTPVVGQDTIREAADMEQDLRIVFRDHPAWKTLIVSAGRDDSGSPN